ncbi:hypothetical protein Tco_1118399 [Tanacetum coccineum]
MGLESLEAKIVVHEKNEAVYEENISFLKYDVQVKDISIKDLKNQLEEALKEKDDLKLKLENFEESSKNLTKLINSQISAKDKTILGYDAQMKESELNNIHMNESEVVHSVFNNRESDEYDNPVNDRFKIDDSVFKSKVSKTITSKDSLKKSKTVRSSAPLIKDWKSDSDDDCVFRPLIEQTKPKFINFVQSGKSVLNNEDKDAGQTDVRPVWNNAQMVNHQNKLTHPHPKSNFVPTAVLTKSGKVQVNTAKQSFPRAAVSNSTARYVNTATFRPTVNGAKTSSNVFRKSHSPVRRTFNQRAAPNNSDLKEIVNTAKVHNKTTAGPKAVVSAAKGKRDNVVKSSACWIWRLKRNVIDHISKDSGSYTPKRFDYVDPRGKLKSVMAWVPKRN